MRVSFLSLAAILFFFLPAVSLAQNSPPVADAGEDQEVFVGEITGLSGSATDPDGDAIVAWLWTLESAPAGSMRLLGDADRRQAIFQPDVAGEYTVSLIANDGTDWSAPDFVVIRAIELLPPVAIATADVTEGPAPLTVHFDGSQSFSPQGDRLVYRWDFADAGSFSTEPSPEHVYVMPGLYLAALRVLDGRDQVALATLLITVTDPTNLSPDCSLATASITTCWPPNRKLTLVDILGVTDSDGDPVTVTITEITQDEPVEGERRGSQCPDGVLVDVDGDGLPEAAGLRCERIAKGNGRVYTVSFTASDGNGGECSGAVQFCVPPKRKVTTCVDDGQLYHSTACSEAGAGGADQPDQVYSIEAFETLTPEPLFLRGDVNWDDETDISDGIAILQALFESAGGFDCRDGADVNDSGDVDVSDAIALFTYLYLRGFNPPPPAAQVGPDPTGDGLDCE